MFVIKATKAFKKNTKYPYHLCLFQTRSITAQETQAEYKTALAVTHNLTVSELKWPCVTIQSTGLELVAQAKIVALISHNRTPNATPI